MAELRTKTVLHRLAAQYDSASLLRPQTGSPTHILGVGEAAQDVQLEPPVVGSRQVMPHKCTWFSHSFHRLVLTSHRTSGTT